MARLPVPGSDDNVWGQILNDFLSAVHNVDGTLKPNVVGTTNIVDASVTAAKLADTFILLSMRGVANGVASLDSSGLVPPSQLPPAGAVPDATTTSKGVVQLAGDISGTATNVTVPGLATKIDLSTVTTKGDLIAATGAGAVSRLGVGVNGRVLTADSTQTTGLSWAAITAAQLPDATTISKGIVQLAGDLGGTAASPTVPTKLSLSTVTTKGDILAATGPSAITRVGVGANNTVLTADSTSATGVSWLAITAGMLPDATAVSKGVVQLAGDLSGTAAAPTVPGKVDKSTLTTKGDLLSATAPSTLTRVGVGTNGQVLTADSTQTAGLIWQNITAAQLPDATTISKGIVQLAGDLGGTALSPSVLKINGIAVSGTPASGDVLTATSSTAATWQATAADADTLAGDTDVSITTPLNGDVLTFNSGTTKWVNQPAPVTSVAGKTGAVTLVEGDITNLTTDLAAKANDNAVVHLAGTETITGAKTFNTNNVTISDVNVVLGTTTGTKIGTATTQKLGFFNATPIAQPTGDISTALSNLGLVATPTIAEGDVTNLTTDLANKVNTSSLGVANGVATLDATGRLTAAQAPPTVLAYSANSTISVKTGLIRLYNDSGATWTILGVRASVGTPSSGASIIVDINVNGTTIFTTQANRPTIAAAANTSGLVTNMDITTIANGSFFTVDIDQVGSTLNGGDLCVQIEVH